MISVSSPIVIDFAPAQGICASRSLEKETGAEESLHLTAWNPLPVLLA
jgi:hypothetical protein